MKNNQVAESFCLKAEECLTEQRYPEALEYFNQCLRFAVSHSHVLSEAYAGRSKVYFETNRFENCLANIQWAIDASVCDEKSKTFKTLEEKCRGKLGAIASDSNGGDDDVFYKLTKPAHSRIPFIANCLEVRVSDIYGRYIMTNDDLKTGDIVVLEEPFYKVQHSQQTNVRCSVCLRQNEMNLFPCAKCSNAMFCSKKCSESVIHRYECIDKKEESFDKLLLQRMFYQAIQITGSLEELQKLMNRQTSSKTVMDFDLSDPNDPMLLKNRILATTSLAEREPWSAEAYAKYESVTQQLPTETEDERNFLRQYLVRCLKSMTVNFFHFFWSPNELEGQGYALCSLAAYFAHSCDPNIEKIDVDNKFAFVVRKPIKAGEQLFMNYDRYSFLTHSLKERQDYFNKIYTFQCGCNACSSDYPELAKLKKFDDKFSEPEVKSLSNVAAIDQYRMNCEYINDNMEQYPSFELCTLMVQNNHLLHAIGNQLPF